MDSRPILICYDGSEDAVRGIEAAAQLFGSRHAVVLDVAPPLTNAESIVATVSIVPGGTFDEINTAEAKTTADQGARIAREAGLDAAAQVGTAAPSWQGICAAADELDAAVIVLGSRGLTGMREALAGSVSHQVAQYAGRPVLIVPPPAHAGR